MTYYVYRTNRSDYAYAIGAFNEAGRVVSNGEIASFNRADVAVNFARGLADSADDVLIMPSV